MMDPSKQPAFAAVYLDGDVLKMVQEAKIFPDQKTFTDMNLKTEPERIVSAFNELKDKNGKLSKLDIKSFLELYFEGPESEFEAWTPGDWTEKPKILNEIHDPHLKNWASHLNGVWKELGRKIKEDVKQHQNRYSLIYLPHPFIVPGGRFREMFYWDTYWTIEGLLLCEVYDTIRGMLLNFKQLIELLGYIPNGSRFTFADRSQPPFLCLMVKRFWQKTKDAQFLSEYIGTLEKEYNFWVKKRAVTITKNNRKYRVYRYWADVPQPRPESYMEDSETGQLLPEAKQAELYRNLRAACESGMDFSSRWMPADGNGNDLQHIKTTEVIPVELNSLVCMNELILSEFFEILGDTGKANEYRRKHNETKNTIRDIHWNEEDGVWFDVTLSSGEHRKRFYPTNISPIFCGCHHTSEDDVLQIEGKVFSYLQRCKVLDYIGGVPSSLEETGQQWDFPNVWPPHEHLVVMSLATMKADVHREKAKEVAKRWLTSNFVGWKKTGHMFEKYGANEIGKPGFGGEYEVQMGFGWTNGTILHLLSHFGKDFQVQQKDETWIFSAIPSKE